MGMKSKQLSPSNLTIQSFNQVGQRTIGTISLKVEIGEVYFEALFHVIDTNTSYNVLLGCPCLHTYGIIGSALHQCFNFVMKMKMWFRCTLILTLSWEKWRIILIPNFKQRPSLCIYPKTRILRKKGEEQCVYPCVNEKIIKKLYQKKKKTR